MDYLTRLARFVGETRFADLPLSTVNASKLVLLDTIGAIVAGSALPENTRLAHMAARRAPHGGARLLGHPLKADPLLATFTNATAGVALEIDEGNRLGGGHPAIHVIPAALAVAEEMRADGVLADARIRAMAARVEVAADPEMALKRADYPTAEVRITLTDGRVLTRTTGVVRGDAANPVAPDEIVAKFLALVGGPLGEVRAREIVEVIEGVDGLKDIRDLTALLAPPQA